MPITDLDSVLILGAGASAQFGLPVGEDLIYIIAQNLKLERSIIQEVSSQYSDRTIVNHFKGKANLPIEEVFNTTPIFSTFMHSRHTSEKPMSTDTLNEMLSLSIDAIGYLTNQTADTIDAFIVQNPSVAELTKISIASLFFSRLYSHDSRRVWSSINQSSRKLKGERNWAHLLINLVRHGYMQHPKTVSEDNPIQIITFNYDTVLEKILTDNFNNIEFELPDWKKLIKITHMHGKMPELVETITDPFEFTFDMAKAIEVATDTAPSEEVTEPRLRACGQVMASRKIYACGFAFSGPNCRLLDIHTPRSRAYLKFCNFDGAAGLRNSAGRYGEFDERKINTMHPRPMLLIEDRPHPGEEHLTITNWFKRGVPGELPA